MRRAMPFKGVDPWLLGAAGALLALGIVMMTSASLAVAEAKPFYDPLYFLSRQSVFLAVSIVLAVLVYQLPLAFWQRSANAFLTIGVVLLLLVLIPAVGSKANGSTRWLGIAGMNLQVSELVKLLVIMYFAGYLARKRDIVTASLKGFLLALVPLGLVALLVVVEPDLGATIVIVAAVLGMFFLAGVRVAHFGLLFGSVSLAGVALILVSPYRMQRAVSFMHACEPQFYHEKGYQLCQALIAFSRGEWSGVGLGSGVQKLFYLPEAHTDFLLAVLGEELGVLGSVSVIVLFGILVYRTFVIGQRNEMHGRPFAAYTLYGIGSWFGVQALINVAVNMGLLPTKGLTLPLMSYGGSSLMITLTALAVVCRADREVYLANHKSTGARTWATVS